MEFFGITVNETFTINSMLSLQTTMVLYKDKTCQLVRVN